MFAQVESLLTILCEETDIAEVSLKVRLHCRNQHNPDSNMTCLERPVCVRLRL